MGILSYVPSQYKYLISKGKGGGGWLRFERVLKTSNKRDIGIQYHPVEFKLELLNPLIFGTFQILVSMLAALVQTIKKVKDGCVHLILSPIETPQAIILAYISSKITKRRCVAFLNSIPFYGLIEVSTLKEVNEKIFYNSLFSVIRGIRKSVVRAILETFIWYFAFRVLSSPSTHVICLSPVVANEFSKLGLKGRIVSVYPGNGIGYNDISSVTPEVNEKKYDAIYAAGNFHPQKGIFDAVKIWGNVIKKNPEAKLAIAGVVHDKSPFIIYKLNNLIRDLGLHRNVSIICDPFKGMTQKELWKEMKRSKIFLYPSRKDVWPLIIGEALACGLSVITYGLPGIEYAYGDCSAVFLQNVGDVEAAAKTVIKLLSGDSLLRKLSHKARQYAENHTWNHVVELERKAYLAILES
jgi:glycosyltransferase involved in cell wall biosynthesis